MVLGCEAARLDAGLRASDASSGTRDARRAPAETDGAPRPDAAPSIYDAEARDASPMDEGAPPPPPPADAAPTPGDRGGASDASDCTRGTRACPVEVAVLPFEDMRDTRSAPEAALDGYACAPDVSEAGPEWVYRVQIARRGLLVVEVADDADAGVDIDVHLLSAPEASACLSRDNRRTARLVEPGEVWVVADTYVNADGVPQAGPFTLRMTLDAVDAGRCAVVPQELEMVWRVCAPNIDCVERENAQGEVARFVRTPSVGPVVKEAHLVTVEDDFGGGWPNAFEDGIEAHWRLSQAATGYAMERREPWAPAGEGGSEFGQSAYGRPLPVLEEAWYVNMYWRRRPAPGTRVLVRNPENGRAVVAAGGYETGPGDPGALGGVAEEVHHHLGTNHRDILEIGFLADPNLPFGPIECERP